MAYSTLLSLETAIKRILDHDRFSISPRAKKHIISIDKYVIFLQAFLEDFPEKAGNLEARIRGVSSHAEDIIERFLWKKIRNSYGYTKRISILRGIMFTYQLQKVRDEMDTIAAEVVEIKNSIIIEEEHLGDSVRASSSSQVVDAGKINVVGLNDDLIEIKDKLCGRAPQLQILSISGMGGIGKTTLARSAYDDQLIVEHFQIRVWVTISQDYSERRILLNLLDSIKRFNLESMAENSERRNQYSSQIPEVSNIEMAVKVHQILTGRRFLIVIDDIWNTKVLDDVKKLLPNDNNGSRIMLTTRLIEVATYANSSAHSIEMRLMDEDQSWNLLRQKVFAPQDRIPCELDSIGREIARSCGGLPLAIVVIGGLLSTTSRTVTSWEEIAKNLRKYFDTQDGKIEKILSLSYSHLPQHLRPCFLYMGGFPEDHEIKVTSLIRLWIAESFVKLIVPKSFEDIAEEYLEDLVNRSLIIVTRRKPNGKIKFCSLHDMVRVMCINLSHDEKFLVHVSGSGASKLLKSMKDQRRISISYSDINSSSNIYSSRIRTIMYFQQTVYDFGSFTLLMVLDTLTTDGNPSLFDYCDQLFHLRYLAIRYHYEIPREISNLQSLQTLIVKDGNSCLPHEIWNMPELRHLILSGIWLPDTNAITCPLENLQTLGKVENLKCSISTLNLIPNLTKLRLTYSRGSADSLFHNLVLLSRLEKLHMELRHGCVDLGRSNLVVPNSRKKLTLIGWGSRGTYLDIVGPFPNLEVLKLKRFVILRARPSMCARAQATMTRPSSCPAQQHLCWTVSCAAVSAIISSPLSIQPINRIRVDKPNTLRSFFDLFTLSSSLDSSFLCVRLCMILRDSEI